MKTSSIIHIIGLLILSLLSGSCATRNKAQDFIGEWGISYPDGTQIHFTLLTDGVATKTPGQVAGKWTVAKDGVWISWQDGWKDNLQIGEQQRNRAYAPGAETSLPPISTGIATRIY